MKPIEFFDYPSLYKRFEADYNRIFRDVCNRGAFILQKDLEQFEDSLAEFLGVNYAVGVGDGTNAIQLGLLASGVKAGDEIIISSHTYIATASAIISAGATPVLADIGPDNLLCSASAEALITAKTRAIMPTQLNGRCCDMDKILELCRKYKIDLFEDAAQAIGAKFSGQSAGSFGKFGTISFYPAKILGCFGDGGALVTNDASVFKKVQTLRDHGRDENGQVKIWGTNCRLDNIQAAFLNFRLTTLDEDLARRRDIARIYNEGLAQIPQLILPPTELDSKWFDVFQNYEIAANNRDELQAFLQQKGIKTLVQWGGKPLHHFLDLGFEETLKNHLPNTEHFFSQCLMLPMNMSVTNQELDFIIQSIVSFYKK